MRFFLSGRYGSIRATASKSSASDALRYGEGLAASRNLESGEILDKSHRTRLGNFQLLDDGVFSGEDLHVMADLIDLAAIEMQSNCDLNTRVAEEKRLAHFVISYNQQKPSEAVLRDTEDSLLSVLGLSKNHFATFLHNDNGYWHLHVFASCIEKEYPYRCNSLWRDKKNRDLVCRQIELRHDISRDHGMHEIDVSGNIVEIPLAERRAKREANPKISDRARSVERYGGEKTFQQWCIEIRIGDRLKHAKSWQDLHAAAAAYHCEVKQKGAGYVVCPLGEKGGIQLSKVGLKSLPAKFGAFQPAQAGPVVEASFVYAPEAGQQSGGLYQEWEKAKTEFNAVKNDALNTLRIAHVAARVDVRKTHKVELAAIRATRVGEDKTVAISVAKLRHAGELTELSAAHAAERKRVRSQLAKTGPGSTFRDYLIQEALGGNDAALAVAQRYGVKDATEVMRAREATQFNVVAAATGMHDNPAPRLNFSHRIERTGTVIFDLGRGRRVIDSAIAKQIQLNDVAALDPSVVETSLRFATSKFGNKLVLTGPVAFQKLAVEIAVKKGLGIRFVDPALDAYREKLEAERKTTQFVQPGKTPLTERKYEPSKSRYRSQQARNAPPAHLRNRLHYLSDRDVVLDTSRIVLPLRADVPGRVEQQRQEESDHRLQRPAASSAGGGGERGELIQASSPDTTRSNASNQQAQRAAAQTVKPDVDAQDRKRKKNADIPPVGALIGATEAFVGAKESEEATRLSEQARAQEEAKHQSYLVEIQWVKEQGGTVVPIGESGSFFGPILKISTDGLFALQSQGRGAVAIHDLSKLAGKYKVGQTCEVKYLDGTGIDKLQEPQRDRGNDGRGL